MTTDTVQEKQLLLKARAMDASGIRKPYNKPLPNKKGIELTRMQNFLDGGYDIFDVLEYHAANSQMKITTKDLTPPENLKVEESSLFKSLLARLKEQMKDIIVH